MEIRRAERKKVKLRLGIAAPSGSGKTLGSILIAFGLGGKVGMIDSENGSGDVYAERGEYDIISIQAPYTIAKYLEAIRTFEDAGYNTIIIDSLSHAWAGEGGLLDKQGKIADRGVNSFSAWRTITPEHNSLIEAMLKSKCHIIATMRSKQDYIMEDNGKGKQMPKKVGLAPVQRDAIDYEFTVMMEIDENHVASSSKDRTGLFDGRFFKLSQDIGRELLTWLDAGVEAPKENTLITAIKKSATIDELKDAYVQGVKSANGDIALTKQLTQAKDVRKSQLSKSPEQIIADSIGE